MKVSIDKEACTAYGLCEETCPEVFRLGDDCAEVIVDTIPPSLEEDVRRAAEDCPVEAIKIEE